MPHLVENGHEVVALVRTPQKARNGGRGREGRRGRCAQQRRINGSHQAAGPEVIIHQLTALGGVGNFKKLDDEFALTNRFRTEVTDTMLAAGRLAGARRFIAQSFCGWPFARRAARSRQNDPLDRTHSQLQQDFGGNSVPRGSGRRAEDMQALALRYGFLRAGTAIAKGADRRVDPQAADPWVTVPASGRSSTSAMSFAPPSRRFRAVHPGLQRRRRRASARIDLAARPCGCPGC